MPNPVYLGRCLCRTIRYRVTGELRNTCFCHCESCRRAAGAPYVAWGTIDRAALEILNGNLALVKSSQDVERGFCDHCGTSLTYSHALRSEEIDITLASLDEPMRVVPQAHIWVQDKLPWITITDSLPQHRRAYGVDT